MEDCDTSDHYIPLELEEVAKVEEAAGGCDKVSDVVEDYPGSVCLVRPVGQ
jgi:hypothetical protein